MKANILILDDEQKIRKLLIRFLMKNGYAISEATSAEEARELLKKQAFELMLCDINLPGESGLDFARFALSNYPQTAAVMITGLDDSKSAKNTIDIGAFDYITKPFEQERVLFSVANALQRRELRIVNQSYREDLEKLVAERTIGLKEANLKLQEKIEQHKRAQKVLCEKDQKYLLLLNTIPGFIYKGYKDWTVDFIDNKVSEFTGFDKKLFDDRTLKWSDLIFNEDLQDAIQVVRRSLKEDNAYIREYRVKTKAGKTLWIQDRGQVVRNEKGKIEYLTGVFFDITEQKLAEKALRENEERHRTIMETCADPIVVYDGQGLATYINPAFNRVFGWTSEELLGKRMDFVPEGTVVETQKAIQKVFQDGRLTGFETRRYTKSGHTIDVRLGAAVLRDEKAAPVGMVVNFQDITEERKKAKEIELLNKQLIEKTSQIESKNRELEQTLKQLKNTQCQIMQSEKMASIGQLAAGVAHEINNPTGFVSSNLKTLSDYIEDISVLSKEYRKLIAELKKDTIDGGHQEISGQVKRIETLEEEVDFDFVLKDVFELIEESREGTERIKKIVQDLKDFSHPGEDKPKFADINQNMDSTVNVVWNELKYKTDVSKDYGDLPQVRCYPQMLNQVFMNILVNAAQSIVEHGEIKIKTRADNGYVEIKIRDTGSGIPKENLSKIFDPFFTTKEVGKGTGLGLNMAYNIIQKHKGKIDVESEVGKGTMFTIRIPITED